MKVIKLNNKSYKELTYIPHKSNDINHCIISFMLDDTIEIESKHGKYKYFKR